MDQPGGLERDRPLLRRHEDRLRREVRLLGGGRGDGHRTAVHAFEQPLAVEALDVPPHRHVGDLELLDELGDAGGTVLLDEGEDGGAPLAPEHQSSRITAAVLAARVVRGPTGVSDTRSWPVASTSPQAKIRPPAHVKATGART